MRSAEASSREADFTRAKVANRDALRLEDCVNDVCSWSGEPVGPHALTRYRGDAVGFSTAAAATSSRRLRATSIGCSGRPDLHVAASAGWASAHCRMGQLDERRSVS